MDILSVFGAIAVASMLVFYALEERSARFVLAFAGAGSRPMGPLAELPYTAAKPAMLADLVTGQPTHTVNPSCLANRTANVCGRGTLRVPDGARGGARRGRRRDRPRARRCLLYTSDAA